MILKEINLKNYSNQTVIFTKKNLLMNARIIQDGQFVNTFPIKSFYQFIAFNYQSFVIKFIAYSMPSLIVK